MKKTHTFNEEVVIEANIDTVNDVTENKTEAVSEAANEEAETKALPPKFTIERLRTDCNILFGVTVSTFDGATSGLKDKYTVEEMKNHIKNWQNKRVIPEEKKEVNK